MLARMNSPSGNMVSCSRRLGTRYVETPEALWGQPQSKNFGPRQGVKKQNVWRCGVNSFSVRSYIQSLDNNFR